jgi:signal transduction histidine kinase/HPt (histidine-containing phosphotransfer) domain-containing protein
VRRLLGVLLGTLGVLVGGLIVVTSLQLQRSTHQADVENRRTESFLVADSMRQSSNDLTLMVRLYVSTGQPRYRGYYDQILAIRNGSSQRPANYDSSFWDRVLSEGTGFIEYGPPQSLTDKMRAAGFASDEFAALSASLRASEQLAQLELAVMEEVAPRIARGVDAAYATDVASAYQRLSDDHYLAEKGVIMRAIDDFIHLVDARTLANVEQARSDVRRLYFAQIGILVAIVLVGFLALSVAKRRALRPLDELIDASRRIADGDYSERAAVKGVSDLEHVASAFNEMVTAVQSDVARRQHAEEVAVDARQAAEDANKAKSSFLASMSHEIRTPMIGVTGMLEVLAQSDLTPPQQQMVETARSSAGALLQIIGDTLDFSKIEAGKLEITSAPFSVRDVVEAAASTFLHTASAKGLTLTSSCDPDIAAAHVGDALRVRQILSNFLSNAVKFTDVGGIELTARLLEERSDGAQSIELAVTDTGVGLSAEQQQRLFDEFVQAEPSTTQRYGGTGLGLVICRQLAMLMGGTVSLESEAGRGTTMRLVVDLPVGDVADLVPDPILTSTRYQTSRLTPTRDEAIRERSLVLLAEDHSVNRKVLLHQLDAIGVCADAARDGQEALELFGSGDYALVLTDIHMPRLTGYELAEAIRSHEAEVGWSRTPVVAVSANVMHGEPQRCRDAGMDDFASKPTTIPLLAAKLNQWLPHLDLSPSSVDPAPPTEANGVSSPLDDDDLAVDPAVLAELTGGDSELASAVLRDFVETSEADLVLLRDAIDARDIDSVRREAHRLKGASAMVGAHHARDVAAQIEAAAAEGTADELVALHEALAACVARVNARAASR